MATAIAIAIFFIMVMLAGNAYWSDIDEAYYITYDGPDMEVTLTLWMLRNDSKNIPLQTNPPTEAGPNYAEGRIYIQREYIAGGSEVTLQLRNARPLRITAESPPSGVRLGVEVLHARIPSHRPIIIVEPKPNSTRTTEIYLDELEVTKIFEGDVAVDAEFKKPMFSEGRTADVRADIFTFSGTDDLWEIEVFDSISDGIESFNGMALFKVRMKLVVDLEDGTQLDTGWMEAQYFALDLVEV